MNTILLSYDPFPTGFKIDQQAVIEIDELSTMLDAEGTVLNKISIDPALI